ncbi:MAG TPA: hypothetical protein VKV06_02750 [Acidimicrobiales bacterium]|nr:hypothetical protein [Acidimicrobiales bacterium]
MVTARSKPRRSPEPAVAAPPVSPRLHPLDRLRLQLTLDELGPDAAGVRLLGTPASTDGTPRRGAALAGGTLGLGPIAATTVAGRLVLAAAEGLPVAVIGLALATSLTSIERMAARRLASVAGLLVLRSEAAAHRLALAGVPAPLRVGADLAWLYDQAPPVGAGAPAAAARADELLIAGEPPDRVLGRALATHLPAVRATGLRPLLGLWSSVPAADGGNGHASADRAAAAAGRRISLDAPVVSWSDAAPALAAAARARVVVAFDVDGLVLAALAGTPAVVVSDDEECLALAAEVGQPALPPAAIGRLVPSLVGQADGRWDGTANVEGLRRRAAESVALLRLVVASDGPNGPSGPVGTGDGLLLWPHPAVR